MERETIEYRHEGVSMLGEVIVPIRSDAPRPAVLVAHTWAGKSEFERRKARALAEEGYVAVAVDLFGEGRCGENPMEKAALIQPLLDDRNQLQGRMRAAVSAAREHPCVDRERIGAIGFCFGGLAVLELARSGADVRGVASLHGMLPPPQSGARRERRARVLVLHGYRDPLAPANDVEKLCAELAESSVDWQIHLYGNAMHAFTNRNANDRASGIVYDEDADRRSWAAVRQFLHEVL